MFGVILIVAVLLFFGIPIGTWMVIKWLKPVSHNYERALGVMTVYAFIVFVTDLMNHTTPYFKDIDPFIENCYSPVSYQHSGLLICLHTLSIVSIILLYFKEFRLPPLLFVIFIIFTSLGIIINILFLFQISEHDTSRIYLWRDGDYAFLYLSIYPILLTFISIGILVKFIRNKANVNYQIKYEDEWLNSINKKLAGSKNLPLFAILLTIPFLVAMLIILILFGQDADSLNNVFSETATWKFSQHTHPDTVDDRHGHYLCTVAACGSPAIVKPIGIGRRNNSLIIINRQLQIANAFEFMVERISPKAHRFIRTQYDTYGFNLSKKINTTKLSNLTYLLMKPLEWSFLVALYVYFVEPEKIIGRQYKMI